MRRLRLIVVAVAVPLLLVAAANALVLLDARGEAVASVAEVPHAQAALVLGAQVKPDAPIRASSGRGCRSAATAA